MASGSFLASPDTRTFAKGASVYREGDRATTAFMVRSGAVQVVVNACSGRQGVTAVAGTGDLFGEEAITGGVRSGSAIAIADGTVTNPVPDDHPELVSMLAERARIATVSLQGLLLYGAAARISRQLADLAERHGVRDPVGVLIPFPLTQERLALMAGTTRESANKALRHLERAGWIRKLPRRQMLIADLDAVRRHAGMSA